jgi:hypothetical protein
MNRNTTPTINQILAASEGDWQALASAAGIIDTKWIEAQRARIASGKASLPPRRRRRTRRASNGESRRRNRSTSIIFSALAELVERVNSDENEVK